MKGDALEPETFRPALQSADGVVHTLGTLLDDGAYKQAIKDGNILGLAQSLLGGNANPLKKTSSASGYDRLNRDSGK